MALVATVHTGETINIGGFCKVTLLEASGARNGGKARLCINAPVEVRIDFPSKKSDPVKA